MDGHEVCRRLRASPDLSGTTFVALTGWGSEEDKQRAQDTGFAYHLVKPVDPDQIVAILRAVTEGRGRSGRARRVTATCLPRLGRPGPPDQRGVPSRFSTASDLPGGGADLYVPELLEETLPSKPRREVERLIDRGTGFKRRRSGSDPRSGRGSGEVDPGRLVQEKGPAAGWPAGRPPPRGNRGRVAFHEASSALPPDAGRQSPQVARLPGASRAYTTARSSGRRQAGVRTSAISSSGLRGVERHGLIPLRWPSVRWCLLTRGRVGYHNPIARRVSFIDLELSLATILCPYASPTIFMSLTLRLHQAKTPAPGEGSAG